MEEANNNAAHSLLGITLGTGWKVVEKIIKGPNATGSFFSVCYKVEKNGETCFLKAFDFFKFFQISEQNDPGRSAIDVISDMLNAFRYERDLSKHCKDKHVTKIAFVKEAGEQFVPGFTIAIVPYLIFDLADGDVRSKLNFSSELDFSWRLRSLHEIAVGLKQLHAIEMSHQDTKPSNVLLFNKSTKLGDIGRSQCKSLENPYKGQAYTGDINYAPPEIHYGYYEEDWHRRVYATDCYHLGSMIVFYFAGVSMSALLYSHILENFRWEKWRGEFVEVKPYLLAGFAEALSQFEASIRSQYFKKELRWLVERLCFPFPEERGHPKNILQSNSNNFSLERFVTHFDLLAKKAEHQILNIGQPSF